MKINSFVSCGFLPEVDPLSAFDSSSSLKVLDEIGAALPESLESPDFREKARGFKIPPWEEAVTEATLPALRLYYVRLGFLASAYINQVGFEQETLLPANIAVPLSAACNLLKRPPLLSYDGYALYNWKRIDPEGPIALGNIDTIQNFVKLYDEHWFILIHVEIEFIAARILKAMLGNLDNVDSVLHEINQALEEQIIVLRRIPEKMSPGLYFKTFRPYIRFFENVIYEGVSQEPVNFRGETGAQSSILPALTSFLKIPHEPSILTNHLKDMRNYMPAEHRQLLKRLEEGPNLRDAADKDIFNKLLESMAVFREVHYSWAEEYINKRVSDPRGTGGTPFMKWLGQLINETRAYMK